MSRVLLIFLVRFVSRAWLAVALLMFPMLIGGCYAQESTAAKESADTFPVPDGLTTPMEYFEFVEQMSADNEGDDLSAEEQKALENKMARTVFDVIDKVLALKPEKQDAMQAHYFRLQAAKILQENRAAGAEKLVQQTIDAARNDADPEVQAVGMKFFIEGGFRRWPKLNKADKQAMLKEVKEFLLAGEPDAYRVNTLLTIISVLQQVGEETLAKPLLAALVPRFQESDNERIQQMGEKLAGTLRRLQLPGNTMKLSGKLMDGSELDWQSYQGKVVLVDFWATWCGPCRQEVPNVLRLYEQYHNKGFEVVGVSLDAELQQAQSYIEQYEIPWPNLFSPNEDERAWEAPMAVHYGVMGIPLAILINRDGKVISLEARGPVLAKLLRELLGEAE